MATVISNEELPSLAALLDDIDAWQSIIANWNDQQRSMIEALSPIDALHHETFARLIRAIKAKPAAALLPDGSLWRLSQ